MVGFLVDFVTVAADVAKANMMIGFELVIYPFYKFLPYFTTVVLLQLLVLTEEILN